MLVSELNLAMRACLSVLLLMLPSILTLLNAAMPSCLSDGSKALAAAEGSARTTCQNNVLVAQ